MFDSFMCVVVSYVSQYYHVRTQPVSVTASVYLCHLLQRVKLIGRVRILGKEKTTTQTRDTLVATRSWFILTGHKKKKSGEPLTFSVRRMSLNMFNLL